MPASTLCYSPTCPSPSLFVTSVPDSGVAPVLIRSLTDLPGGVSTLSEIEEARVLQYQCECLESACIDQGKHGFVQEPGVVAASVHLTGITNN